MKTTDYLLNQNVRSPMRAFLTTQMKCAALFAVISLAFVSQIFGLLRPLVPVKSAPPSSGAFVIGDDLAVGPASNHLLRHRSLAEKERRAFDAQRIR